MRFWRVATLLALASIPLLFINTNPKRQSVRPAAGDDDDIFEHELKAD